MKNNILFSIAVLLSLLSSAAIASTSLATQNSLEKMIQMSIEQKHAAEAKKYDQLIALAGDRQDELARRKAEAGNAYKKWHDLKSAVETSRSQANYKDYKAVELASQAYSEARKSYIDMQKDILTKSKVAVNEQTSYMVVMH